MRRCSRASEPTLPQRNSSRTPQCYHLDTNYVINYLLFNYVPTDETRTARQVVNRLLDHEISVKASAITVGEFVKKLKKFLAFPLLNDLAGLIEDETFQVHSLEESCIGQLGALASRIRQDDNRIEPMDVFIVAHSFIDVECRGLLTFERNLIDSLGLKRMIDASPAPKNRFQITSMP